MSSMSRSAAAARCALASARSSYWAFPFFRLPSLFCCCSAFATRASCLSVSPSARTFSRWSWPTPSRKSCAASPSSDAGSSTASSPTPQVTWWRRCRVSSSSVLWSCCLCSARAAYAWTLACCCACWWRRCRFASFRLLRSASIAFSRSARSLSASCRNSPRSTSVSSGISSSGPQSTATQLAAPDPSAQNRSCSPMRTGSKVRGPTRLPLSWVPWELARSYT
mmetsp:Transcript_117655/g.333441  ORF Transcript_117655/g.333441 Transcript_117655/m.333441 type:complete len:223 (-) Transcript_117655:294-962(-)